MIGIEEFFSIICKLLESIFLSINVTLMAEDGEAVNSGYHWLTRKKALLAVKQRWYAMHKQHLTTQLFAEKFVIMIVITRTCGYKNLTGRWSLKVLFLTSLIISNTVDF